MAPAAVDSGFILGGTNGAGTIWKLHSTLLLVQIAFAVANIFQKISFTAGINPIAYSVYRDVVAVSCLVPMAFFSERGQRTTLDWTTLSLIVLSGFLGMYAAQLLLTFGISLAPGTYGCLIGITTPIFVFLISAATKLEEIKWTRRGGQMKVLGVLSAICGGVIIPVYEGPEIIRPLRDTHLVPLSELPVEVGVIPTALSKFEIEDWQLGGFLLILTGFVYAVYWTLQAYIMKKYPRPVSTAALAYVSGALMLAATGLLTIRDPSKWAIHPSTDILSILYVGLIASGMNFALQTWALFKAGPLLFAGYAPVQSCTTIVIAWLFLGEGVHLGSVLGLLFIVNGLFLITWGQLTSRKEANRPVKIIPGTMDGALIIKGDSNLEEHLLG